MEPGVPDLDAYLGEAKWYLDRAFGLSSEGLEAISGTQKWSLKIRADSSGILFDYMLPGGPVDDDADVRNTSPAHLPQEYRKR